MNLTSPRLPTFLLSLALMLLATASLFHIHIPAVGSFVAGHRIGMFIAAYLGLALGVILQGL